MADVAQLVERRFVVPVVAGSIPVVRPSQLNSCRLSVVSCQLSEREMLAIGVVLSYIAKYGV